MMGMIKREGCFERKSNKSNCTDESTWPASQVEKIIRGFFGGGFFWG